MEQGKKDLIELLRSFILLIYFGSDNKSKKQYNHICQDCGKMTLFDSKPDQEMLPPRMWCLQDECIWNHYQNDEIRDLKNLFNY